MAVDTPKHLLRGEIACDSLGLPGLVGVDDMSARFLADEKDLRVRVGALIDETTRVGS
jgi:hypothetical protein